MYILLFTFAIIIQSSTTFASAGDRSPFYQNCVKTCLKTNCTQDGTLFTKEAAKYLDVSSRLLWSCRDECKYHCMWRTVDIFHQRDYQTPKFHGKWPFYRVLGIQEPASALTSLLNLASHVFMHAELRRRFPAGGAPVVLLWHVFAAVCMNAWVWSTIFHTRDTPLTEFMDYACALSMVMAHFIAAVLRVFHRRRALCGAVLFTSLLYYVEHARYLYTGRIDYEYNIIVNVLIGACGSMLWTCWCCVQYVRAGRGGAGGARYVWRMVAFTALSAAALSLELFDFPPRGGGWDAHALWHLSTAPLPILFYRFVMDDLSYLQKTKERTHLKIT